MNKAGFPIRPAPGRRLYARGRRPSPHRRLLEEAKAAAQIVAMPVAAALARRRTEIDALLSKPDASIGASERSTLTRERDRIAEIIKLAGERA
jgi:hypothetical protein